MRHSPLVEDWLAPEALRSWLDASPTPVSQRRRLAVWMSSLGTFSTADIASALAVTPEAVRRWVHQYNELGPASFDGPGRGGRRRARLSADEEAELLAALHDDAAAGRLVTVPQVRQAIETRTGEAWPLSTVYALLHRHKWRRIMPRPRHPRADAAAQDRFKKSSEPSWRSKSPVPQGVAFASSSRTRRDSGG